MVAVITVLTLLSSFSTALSPTNASEDHSQHLTKLSAPNGVVTVPGSTSTVLRFSAVPNATSYKVRVYTVKGENPLRTIALFNSGQSVSALTPNSTYKITVQAIGNGVRYSNSEESRKVSVTTLSALAIPAFSLTPTVKTATAGQLFTSPTPVSTGGAIASFSIDVGTFPINGLTFNTSTGVISGTPITAWITNTYTITAHNSSGITSQSFTLITQAAPTVPDLSGLLDGPATSALVANGFVKGSITTTDVGATALNDGQVKSQTPTAGSVLAAGNSVAVVVYAYVAPAAPVVTAAHTPSAGGTATATDTFTGGMWSLSATPAAGYTFTSWACSNGAFVDNASLAETFVTPGSDITCNATFSVAPVVLYFNINYFGNGNDSGSLWGDGFTTFDVGTTATVTDELGTVAKFGYIFAGWNTQANGSGTARAVGDTFVMPSSDVDLYAQWVNNTFNITWSDNGGAGTSGGDSTFIGGSQITGFPTMLPTYSGFKFIGWNTSPDGLGTDVSSGYMPQIIWPNSYSDITLYAKWANNTFNITWDQNFNPNTQGHWPSSGDSTYVGGSAVAMPMQPVQDGYAFAAWQASDSSTSVAFSYVPIAPYGDITFTAVWTAIDILVDPILDAGPMNPWTYWDGGESLTLTGSGFIAGTTVTIGGSNASITSLTDTSITVLTPIANDPGHMTVVVTSPNGSSASTTYFYQIT